MGYSKGKAIGAKREETIHSALSGPHSRRRRAQPNRGKFQIPVQPVELLFLVNDNFQHPLKRRVFQPWRKASRRCRAPPGEGPGLYPRQSLQSPGHEGAAAASARSGQ